MLQELRKVRRQGYSRSCGEVIKGAAAISVPVRGHVCPVALSIIGPENRFAPKMIAILEELKNSAKLISNKLKGKTAAARE